MFAITSLLIEPNGEVQIFPGTLVPSPAEIRSGPRIPEYKRILKPGWGTDSIGYRYFASIMPSGGLLIFPGLQIIGEAKPKRRLVDYEQQFTKEQIEQFAAACISHFARQEKVFADRINLIVHDIRALSTAIYHAAQEAKDMISEDTHREASKRIENVIASQNMLKMRTDAIDFEGNRLDLKTVPVPIYKKVDKVVRCFKPRAASQGKTIDLKGSSFLSSSGPDIFEIAMYALIDNAIKYCPKGSAVDVSVYDGKDISVVVRSLGPKIEIGEESLIFLRGRRGSGALATGIPGSGLGLSMAQSIVEMFQGSIEVSQSRTTQFREEAEYFETTFEVRLPLTKF